MRRRDFITLLGATATWPLEARAQPARKVYRIGMLETISETLNAANLAAFRESLHDLGHIERKNFVIEYRSADGRAERFADLATELVDLKVDLIVTRGTPATLAAKTATTTIPVVMAAVSEPFGSGLVVSLARPGGNITGLSSFATMLDAKRVELLREAVPGIARIATFLNMGNPVQSGEWKAIEVAAQSMGIQPQLVDLRRVEDIEPAFRAAIAQHAEALVVGIDAVMALGLSLRYRLPCVDHYPSRLHPFDVHVRCGGKSRHRFRSAASRL